MSEEQKEITLLGSRIEILNKYIDFSKDGVIEREEIIKAMQEYAELYYLAKCKNVNNYKTVEWLEFEINRRGPKEDNPPQWLKELYKQAKEMEQEQRKKDYRAGWNDNKHKDWNCEFYLEKHLTGFEATKNEKT
jgi:hypothetical protein